MQAKRRTRLSSRPRLSVAAAAAPCSRGWLAIRRRPPMRPRRLVDSDGTPLTDEILVSIFAGLPEIADLVRVAATCRRWGRLVSSDAAFISRTTPRPVGYLPCLALGFFHQDAAAVAPRFAPTASAVSLLGLRQSQTSLNKLVEEMDDEHFNSCLVVASRNGLLVVDIHRGKRDRSVRLCVCNPMTGETDILPPLTGKEGVGHYACALLTANDHHHENSHPPQSSSVYRLLIVYSRLSFTASRCYSSAEGTWSPETEVTNAKLGKIQMKIQMRLRHAATVVSGGKEVYWIVRNKAFGINVDTFDTKTLSLPYGSAPCCRHFTMASTLLGVSPNGRLCAVQIEEFSLVATETRPRSVALRVYTWITACDDDPIPWNVDSWEKKELIQVEQFLPAEVINVRLRWFFEKSGVVLFTVGYSGTVQRSDEVYALSLETQKVEKVASHDGGAGAGDGNDSTAAVEPWRNFHGYEMDLAAYLVTLGDGAAAEE